MSPNVMPGHECIHSIAAAAVNHNAAAAPPLSEDRHCITELQAETIRLKTGDRNCTWSEYEKLKFLNITFMFFF